MVRTGLISVIMPVYNGDKFLRTAMESIISQTYTNFEFLIINDGSKDNSNEIIKSYTDPRIIHINNPTNLGLTPTLNKGLSLATGEFIARMDCDDKSHPDRFRQQIEFLTTNPDYGVVASLVALVDENFTPIKVGGVQIIDDYELQLSLFFGNVFMHGETMFRKELMEKYNLKYDENYKLCEDYKLWVEFAKISKLKTLPEVLYYYQVNPNGMSGTRWDEMQNWINIVAKEVRDSKKMPNFSFQEYLSMYKKGINLKDEKINIDNVPAVKYLQRSYQIYLVRLGKTYLLKKLDITGIIPILISFLINPINWITLIYIVLTTLGYKRIRLR
jgi:glycosyltransferase involved in cell wall biosynthesis